MSFVKWCHKLYSFSLRFVYVHYFLLDNIIPYQIRYSVAQPRMLCSQEGNTTSNSVYFFSSNISANLSYIIFEWPIKLNPHNYKKLSEIKILELRQLLKAFVILTRIIKLLNGYVFSLSCQSCLKLKKVFAVGRIRTYAPTGNLISSQTP